LIFRKIKVEYSEETSSDQQRSPVHPMIFKIQTDTTIASALTDILILNSHCQELRTEKSSFKNARNSKNPLIKILVEKSMK
jgi:hypothetical protein